MNNRLYSARAAFGVARLMLPLAAEGELVDHVLVGVVTSCAANMRLPASGNKIYPLIRSLIVIIAIQYLS